MFRRHGSGEQPKVGSEPHGEIMGMDEYNKKYVLEPVDEYWSSQGEPTVEDWGPPAVLNDSATQRKEADQLIRDLLDRHFQDR